MFAQSWRALSDNFYDAKHHGADWAAVRDKYLPLVAHTATREDLYALVNLMLGELNASHLGISGKMPVPDELTADLGLIFDDTYRGPGLKVAEVLKRGPADKRGLDLKPGDIVLAIDRVELTDKVNLSKLLNDKTSEAVLLEVASDPKDAKTKRKVEVVAVGPRPHVATDVRALGAAERRRGGEGERREARLHPHPEHGRRWASTRSSAPCTRTTSTRRPSSSTCGSTAAGSRTTRC